MTFYLIYGDGSPALALTFASADDSPPPPYSVGQVGAVQPFAPITSSQVFISGTW